MSRSLIIRAVLPAVDELIIFGYIFYSHLPDLLTIVGATIIMFSGIYIAKQKLISKKK